MNKVTIISPWNRFYQEISLLFEDDDDIKVEINEADYQVNIYCASQDKAFALERILPHEKEFGNIKVTINVYPPNLDELSIAELYDAAFVGNEKYSYATKTSLSSDIPFRTYVVFYPGVAQYFSDNLKDVHGKTTLLFEDLARNVLDETAEVCFCSDER